VDKTTKRITARILASKSYSLLEKQRILKGIDGELRKMVSQTDPWFLSNLRYAYKSGMSDDFAYFKRLGVKNMKYTDYDYDSIKNLAGNSKKLFDEAVSGIGRSSSSILSKGTKAKLQAIISEGRVEKGTLRGIKGMMLDYMDKQGVYLLDSAGRKWDAVKYSEMFARTEMMNTYNQGAVNGMLGRGMDLAEITSYSGCQCDICLEWEGEIVSLTGKTEGYRTLDDAYNAGVFHPNCFSDDTEVYTNEGWKLFKNLQGEKIMSIDPETQEMEWVDYVEHIAYEYKGKVFSLKSNSFDLMVTPDHMMYVGTNSHGKGGRGYIKWQLMSTSEAIKKNHKQLRTANWEGKEVESPLEGIDIKQYAFLLGAYLAEGHIDRNKVIISQSEPRKNRYRKELLGMGFYENKNRFIISNKQWAKHFKKFGKSYEKYMPEFVLEAIPEILKELLRGYHLGDGSVNKSKYKGFESKSKTYFTSSERLAGQLGEAIFKVGKYPSFRKPPKPRAVKFSNGEYLPKHACWVIRENNSKRAYYNLSPSIAYRGVQLKKVDYNGYVYDVELEKNHVLLVRRNGKTAWSGNCKHRFKPYYKPLKEEYDSGNQVFSKSGRLLHSIL